MVYISKQHLFRNLIMAPPAPFFVLLIVNYFKLKYLTTLQICSSAHRVPDTVRFSSNKYHSRAVCELMSFNQVVSITQCLG